MWIKRVFLSNFRNFTSFSADLSAGVTLIYGENGSGKTSIMEAIALFGLGRSFRGSKIKGLTKIGEKQRFQVALTLEETKNNSRLDSIDPDLGKENQCFWVEDDGSPHRLRFRADGEAVPVADMVNKVPLQLFHSNSFQLLEASSVYRRQVLDWGCFFLSPRFSDAWQRYSSILRQRNALLRTSGVSMGQHRGLWEAWNRAFLEAAQVVESLRQAYWAIFEPRLMESISQFFPRLPWSFTYNPGWSIEKGLDSALRERFGRDSALGYTSVGPHRADIEMTVHDVPAKQVLSRGQTKLLICAVLMARAQLLFDRVGRSSVFLIDDADAELDASALDRLFEGLQGLGTQWVATSVRPEGPWSNKRAENCIFLPSKTLSVLGV